MRDQIKELLKEILEFREARDWKQFHTKKDMLISLSLEVSELMEHVQWKSEEQFETYLVQNKEAVADELADVFYWTLLLAHDLNIDLVEAARNKIKKNAKKYPVVEFKGQSRKYTEVK